MTYHLAQSMSHEGFVNVRTNGIRLPNECGDASYSVTAKFCTAMGSAIVCEVCFVPLYTTPPSVGRAF